MRKPRGTVLFAWALFLVVGASSVIGTVNLVREKTGTARPLELFAGSLFELLPLLFAVTGMLIISRHPRHVIGWLLVGPSLVFTAVQIMGFYLAGFGEAAPPPTLPVLLMILIYDGSWVAAIFPLLLIPLLFPTGRPISPGWRWPIYLAGGMVLLFFGWMAGTPTFQPEFASWTITNPIGFLPDNTDEFFMPIWSLLLLVLMIASLTSVIVRYRRASTVEREQMKWLLYAATIFSLVFGPSVIIGGTEEVADPVLADTLDLLFALAVVAIPAAITIAILRYHLFDIDVIIRLTLLYAIVTGMLGLLYMGGVVLLQEAFRGLTGQVSDLAVVLTTLAIASLFNPLRLRIQTLIDRRFFRQKYNAEQALAEFANTARSGADLDALTGILLDIAQKSLQPTQVNLYLQSRNENNEIS